MSDSILFETYGNVAKLLLSWGYRCKKHDDIIRYVESNDENGFVNHLKNNFTNYTISGICQDPLGISIWEKLLSVWKHTEEKKEVVLYFANHSSEIKYKVSKEEAVRSIRYLAHLKKNYLVFAHRNPISTMCQKHLQSLQTLTNNRYTVNIICEPHLRINPACSFWVPKHELIKFSPEFYEREGLTRGTLPKICQNDPGIAHLGASVGDIIRIERTEDFDVMSTIAFREVIKPSAEFNTKAKKK